MPLLNESTESISSSRPAANRWPAGTTAGSVTGLATSSRTLVDALLAEQRSLTAVDRFSRWHEVQPAQPAERSYRKLIPLTAPKPGEQFAFEVDLDKCSGCKACVTACHSLNGLDENETWRSVGLLVGRSEPAAPSSFILHPFNSMSPPPATTAPIPAAPTVARCWPTTRTRSRASSGIWTISAWAVRIA